MENIKYIGKDQLWQDETTNYWFNVENDGKTDCYALSDNNGIITVLNSNGEPIDYDDVLRNKITDEIINDY